MRRCTFVLFFCSTILTLLTGCYDKDDSPSLLAEDPIVLDYVSQLKLASTGITEDALIGAWIGPPARHTPPSPNPWPRYEMTYFNDHTGKVIKVEEEIRTPYSEYDWSLTGSAVTYTWQIGQRGDCLEASQSVTTVAPVGNELRKGVLVRVSGSGDTMDGIWKRMVASVNVFNCGENEIKEFCYSALTLNITGDTFTGTYLVKNETRLALDGEMKDGYNDTMPLRGAIIRDGDQLVLDVPNSKYALTLRRIKANAMTAVIVETATGYMLNSEGIFTRVSTD